MKNILFLLSFIGIVGVAHAGFEEGVAAYEKGDLATALKELLPAAEQGDVLAQNSLAGVYANERVPARDYKQAIEWYRKAAEQGYAIAQYNLGLMYANGWGVPRDDKQALDWYRKAAEQGRRRGPRAPSA